MRYQAQPPPFAPSDEAYSLQVLLISPSIKLAELSQRVVGVTANSPNCAEFMSKYKKAGTEKVTEVKVIWSTQGRDSKTWPTSTVLTDDNIEAVLRLIEDSGVGKDVFEIKLEKDE